MHESEFHRCLIEADVAGIMRVWAVTSPHLAQLGGSDAFLALHMARVEARSIPRRLKEYSLCLLQERGIERIDGKWTKGASIKDVIAETVGIASSSSEPGFAKLIVRVMSDALSNARAKGVVAPIEQRLAMLDARRKYKFRWR